MGRAVCLRCGAYKWGALTTCRDCAHHPDDSTDQARHLLASDDHQDTEQLEVIRMAVTRGEQFEPDADELAALVELVEATPTAPVGFALLVVLVPLGLLLGLLVTSALLFQ